MMLDLKRATLIWCFLCYTCKEGSEISPKSPQMERAYRRTVKAMFSAPGNRIRCVEESTKVDRTAKNSRFCARVLGTEPTSSGRY